MATATTTQTPTAWAQLQALHWPEYLMEAANLGLFMLSACVFGTLLEHPSSQLHHAIEDAFLRRAFMGLAMGLTAIAIIHSPFGQRSGAHMNPAVTLTYWSLGKLEPRDALCYIGFQFLGGITGVWVADLVVGPPLEQAGVNFAVTKPGPEGPWIAFVAEYTISTFLMLAVLFTSNFRPVARFTPMVAGLLVATYITWEAPISGMSMNPARTFASALAARDWDSLWIYFLAPPAGMLSAGLLYRLRRGIHTVFCGKLHHHNSEPCIFRCSYGELR